MKAKALLTGLIISSLAGIASVSFIISGNKGKITSQASQEFLPGTKLLGWQGDFSAMMMDSAHLFIERKIDESLAERINYWKRDFTSPKAYDLSVDPNRKRFMNCIGVEDKNEPFINYRIGMEDRNPPVYIEKYSVNDDPEIIAEAPSYRVFQVRWPVLNKISGEGLLLEPKTDPVANIIAIPDAGQTPEQLAGLAPGISPGSQFARKLAENGFRVLIPLLISRKYINEGKPEQMTYRERIYRQAFHMGRHIIGYEVQKVISAIDCFQLPDKTIKTGVAGYNEGGLIAFYAAAVDKRIDAVLVSGYFNSRQNVWDEPLYRNVWGLLSEFGDAEIASLIAPRPLIVEYSKVPGIVEEIENFKIKPYQVNGFPYTGYKGKLKTPLFKDVKSEYNRIDDLLRPGFQKRYLVTGKGNEPADFGSEEALGKLSSLLGAGSYVPIPDNIPADKRKSFNSEERQLRQVNEIEAHLQWLMYISDKARESFFLYKLVPEIESRQWSTKSYHPYLSPSKFIEGGKEFRKYFHEEILGKFDDPYLPLNPRTRKIYDKERWTGYEVILDVHKGLFAWGIILIPKDIQPGEKRPVVVCQHGRSGLPKIIVEGNSSAYNDVGAKLADRGFIVYAPFNLYRGEDRYRFLDKKANTVKKTLFSFIISQHEQTLKWLSSLPFTDKDRIAFYGLSYGGETAMRVPAVLENYCLSICSGDFGNWTRKVADTYGRSFVNTIEWEMPYFNMGNTFSYAEMAYLIFPRPFMVERGHDDLVQSDECVAYEYGKVKYIYDKFNLGDRTTIEYFNGGHSMRCEGTFDFLHRHLRWP